MYYDGLEIRQVMEQTYFKGYSQLRYVYFSILEII